MKAATSRELKIELQYQSKDQLLQLCLRLARFKKENKELLTYLLFEADNESSYIESVKAEIDSQFEQINTTNYYYIKKSARKILRMIKKFIRYSTHKETEIELLLHFCKCLKKMNPPIERNKVLQNLYHRQLLLVAKNIDGLHEDLQYDYNLELNYLRR